MTVAKDGYAFAADECDGSRYISYNIQQAFPTRVETTQQKRERLRQPWSSFRHPVHKYHF